MPATLYIGKEHFSTLTKWIGEQRTDVYRSILKNHVNLTYDYIGRSTTEFWRRKLNVEEGERKTECVKLNPVFFYCVQVWLKA